jgi:hypothetical protein
VPIQERGDPFPFLFQEEDYLEANGSHKLTISNAVVVGWYRVGDGEGVSDTEVLTHKAFFKFPWQLLLKVDRENKEYSLYRGGSGSLELVDLVLYNSRFKGYFDPAAGEGSPSEKSKFAEKYSGSIQRARKVIQELEEALSRKDQELQEMRASVRTEIASKIGTLEDDLKAQREKIHSLRTVVLREPQGPVEVPPPASNITEVPARRRNRMRRVVAAAACAGFLMLGAFAYLTEPAQGEPENLARTSTAVPVAPAEAPPPAPEPVVETPRVITHMVGEGDNLWNISRKYFGEGIRYKEIAAANGLTGGRDVQLKVGTFLTIPLGE